MPADLAAERAVIGACLLSARARTETALIVTDSDFILPSHSAIWHAIATLAARGDPVDPVTVAAHAHLADADLPTLTSIQADTPSTTNAAGYAHIVARHSRARQLILWCHDTTRTLAGELGDPDTTAGELRRQLDTLTAPSAAIPWGDVLPAVRGETPPVEPSILRRGDGRALIYPGLSHWLASEPSWGKTMIALHALLEVVDAGGVGVLLDYEAGQREIGQRLAALGAGEKDLQGRFFYLAQSSAVTPALSASLAAWAADTHPVLVVVDGVAKGIARQGGDEDRASDVLAWLEAVVQPFGANGTAVLLLDHVIKTSEGRGRWARGSGAKLGEVQGVAYGAELLQSFSRSQEGRVLLRVQKDREGCVGSIGEAAAEITLTPGDSGSLQVRVEAPSKDAVVGEVPIGVAVVRALDTHGGEVLTRDLPGLLAGLGYKFRAEVVRHAADRLATDGEISVRVGARKSRYYSALQRPYFEDEGGF